MNTEYAFYGAGGEKIRAQVGAGGWVFEIVAETEDGRTSVALIPTTLQLRRIVEAGASFLRCLDEAHAQGRPPGAGPLPMGGGDGERGLSEQSPEKEGTP